MKNCTAARQPIPGSLPPQRLRSQRWAIVVPLKLSETVKVVLNRMPHP